MAWSIAPDASWAAFDRVVVYGAFALLGVLAVRVARPARTIAAGLAALLALVLLWALAGKVVPALFPGGARVARLRNPIDYWNSRACARPERCSSTSPSSSSSSRTPVRASRSPRSPRSGGWR
jgi:hypothetical protein